MSENNPNPEEVTQPPSSTETEGVKEEEGFEKRLARQYAEAKFSDPGERNEFYNRALEFGKGTDTTIGAVDLADKLATANETNIIFVEFSNETQTEQTIDLQATKAEFTRLMQEKMAEELKGQESKLANARLFIDELSSALFEIVNSESQSLTTDERKEKLEAGLELAAMAVEAINYQDLAANAVTLGDHGWHHLVQDMHDSMSIAEGLKDEPLDAKEKLMFILASAFHDIGYASDQISKGQVEDSKNYYLDKGHPLLSFVFIRQNPDKFLSVLSQEEYDGLCTIVINHENPERASDAGDYEILSKSFSHADAAASVGREKVPPVFAQVPEFLMHAYYLNQAQVQLDNKLINQEQYNKLIVDSRQEITQILNNGDFDEEQSNAMLNVLDDTHLSSRSLNFILGRLTGETESIKVEENSSGGKRIVLGMNLGEAIKVEKFLPGAVKAGAKLSIKVFGEQAGLKMGSEQKGALENFMLSGDGDELNLDDLGVSAVRKGDTVEISTESIKLVYNPNQEARGPGEGEREFYDTILDALSEANEKLVGLVNENSPVQTVEER